MKLKKESAMDVLFTSILLDEEVLAREKYKIFCELRAIEGVDIAHFQSVPNHHEKGGLEIMGFILKAIAPGAITQVVKVFSEGIARKPDIRLRIGELELETSDLSLPEVKELLFDIMSRE